MDNKVRELRIKAGRTQSALAKEVGTSQQQIHRIEQGQAARLDLALRICTALGAPMDRVFPKTRTTLRKLEKKAPEKMLEELLRDPDAQKELGKEGIDADPAHWMFKLQLTNGVTRVYNVSGPERRRLWSILQQRDEDAEQVSFMVFETETQTVALNRRALAYGHLLFDAPFNARDEELGSGMSVFFENHSEPLDLDVEPDDPPDELEDPDEAQLRSLLFELETCVERDRVFVLTDVDGETAFIRADSVALIEISKNLTEAPADFEEADESSLLPSGEVLDTEPDASLAPPQQP